MTELQIIKATLSDLNLIRDISIQTFTETFASNTNQENIETYIREYLDIDILQSELGNTFSSFFLAKVGDKIIGYLKLNWGSAQTENIVEKAIEIQRIYVLQEHHGKQVGQHLLRKAIEITHDKKLKTIWLGVWESNHKALQFYKKHGFVAFDQHIFMMGNEKQTDLLLRLELS
jgi:ribosomal protein S18 acetylase RimI-like enzyme